MNPLITTCVKCFCFTVGLLLLGKIALSEKILPLMYVATVFGIWVVSRIK